MALSLSCPPTQGMVGWAVSHITQCRAHCLRWMYSRCYSVCFVGEVVACSPLLLAPLAGECSTECQVGQLMMGALDGALIQAEQWHGCAFVRLARAALLLLHSTAVTAKVCGLMGCRGTI